LMRESVVAAIGAAVVSVAVIKIPVKVKKEGFRKPIYEL
jgi:hypothetical protein